MFHGLRLSCTAASPQLTTGSYMTWGEKQNESVDGSKALLVVMMTIVIIIVYIFNN
jgi:hypothetical protein